MEAQDIRLACLKLAHQRTGTATEVIADAQALVDFVLGNPSREGSRDATAVLAAMADPAALDDLRAYARRRIAELARPGPICCRTRRVFLRALFAPARAFLRVLKRCRMNGGGDV